MTPLMSKIQLLKNEIFHLYETRNARICPSVEGNIGRANSLTSFAVTPPCCSKVGYGKEIACHRSNCQINQKYCRYEIHILCLAQSVYKC